MSFGYGQALDPLLCVGPVLGLQDEGLVVGEDLEGLRDVPATLLRHLDGSNRTHVQRLSHRTRFPVGLRATNPYELLIWIQLLKINGTSH